MGFSVQPAPGPVLKSGSQASVDGYVQLFKVEQGAGISGDGTVKETGGVNGITVKEMVTDAFGVTTSVETAVAANGRLLLQGGIELDTGRPPYISYEVQVKSTVAGQAGTAAFRFTAIL